MAQVLKDNLFILYNLAQIDQGAICRQADTPQVVSASVATCRGVSAFAGHREQGEDGGIVHRVGADSQPVVFSCVEYYTT